MRPGTADVPGGRAGARVEGLTLIEMLVTLAIVSMLAAILSQAMSQVYRVERLLESGQLDAQARLLRIEQLRIAIEAALPTEASSPDALAGDARHVRFLSSEPPTLEPTGPTMVTLDLYFDEDAQRTELRCRVEPAGQSAVRWVVQSWPGRSGVLRYLNRNGLPVDGWPIVSADAGTLPRAINVDPQAEGVPVLLAQLPVGRRALQSRRELVAE